MEKIKAFSKLVWIYILGNLVFNLICSLTEMIGAKLLSFRVNFLTIFGDNVRSNIVLYTILHIVIMIGFYGINLYIVKVLNQKLKRGETSEE